MNKGLLANASAHVLLDTIQAGGWDGLTNLLRDHIDAQAAEIARLRAAEVPLSANVGFAVVTNHGVHGDSLGGMFPTADEATEVAGWADATPVALIPLTAWDRA